MVHSVGDCLRGQSDPFNYNVSITLLSHNNSTHEFNTLSLSLQWTCIGEGILLF